MSDATENHPSATHGARPELFMTVLRVGDWAGQVAWYVETLGLELVLRDEATQFALLGAGTGRLGLQGKRRDGVEGRSRVRLVFQVGDLDRERERLAASGVILGETIENSTEGYRELRLRDPEGNSLTLFAWTRDGGLGVQPAGDQSQTGD